MAAIRKENSFMLDFNTAELQTTGKGPIPPDSCVILQMEIRNPKSNKQGSHPLLSRSDKGNEYLDVEFKVARGSYEGKTIWQNFTVAGSEQASKISMRTLRAIIESARQIDPNDQSPQAAQGRMLQDWADFQGIQFMARVDAKAEKAYNSDDVYVNNHIKKIITPDMEEYAIIAQHGEIISDNPLPERVAEAKKPQAAAPAWGGVTTSAAPAATTQTTASPSNTPAWAVKK